MRYERERGICDLLRVELETGEAVIAEVGKFLFARGAVAMTTFGGPGEVGFAGDQRCGGNRGLRPIGDIPPADFEAQYYQQAEVA